MLNTKITISLSTTTKKKRDKLLKKIFKQLIELNYPDTLATPSFKLNTYNVKSTKTGKELTPDQITAAKLRFQE